MLGMLSSALKQIANRFAAYHDPTDVLANMARAAFSTPGDSQVACGLCHNLPGETAVASDAGQPVGNSSRRCSVTWSDIMTIYRRARAGLVASGVFMLGLFCAGAVNAAPVNNQVMLINDKTGKCLTIAGGETTANNVDAVQFD